MVNLTILTTTYNRAEYLKRCYKSLTTQTNMDFEWIIIDDGSEDDTEVVVNEIILSNTLFPIKYYKKQNGGKHRAINYAQQFIAGKYLIILDDDDELTFDAVEIILRYWEKYKVNPKIWCLSFEKCYNDKKIVQTWHGDNEILSNHIYFRVNSKISGDCAEVVRSDVFNLFKFPEFENEKFLGEACIWVIAAQEYDTVYIKKAIYICEYLEGGLSKSGRKMRLANPQGGMYTSSIYFEKKINWRVKFKNMLLFDCYAVSSKEPFNSIRKNNHKIWLYLFLPFGWILYNIWSK